MEVDEDRTERHRLVHLDLKGAPPKLSYIEQMLPLWKRWGATGLLVEYEDMFPYTDQLSDLASPNAYSIGDVQNLQELAKVHGLIVIPLLQTFGHFEFVLKHEKFHEIREVPDYPMTLCPLHSEAPAVVNSMIDQQMALHPNVKWLHIGADEVFHLGVCQRCQEYMSQAALSPVKLYLQHVVRVLGYVREKYPQVQPIMWDDMLRETPEDVLRESKLGELVDLMVWNYHSKLHFPSGMWKRYSSVFSGLWAASAFKGATGPCMYVTDVAFHKDNQHAWLAEMKNQHHHFTFHGYCITGWQRYDHFSVLCELLPAGLPSLAVCLLTLTSERFSLDVHKQASADLGFKDLLPLAPFQRVGAAIECQFPGHEVYCGTLSLLHLEHQYNVFLNNDRLSGWMSPYHVSHRYVNPAHLQHFLPEGHSLLHQFEALTRTMERALGEIFFPDAVEEWLAVNIHLKTDKVKDIVHKATELIQHGCWPKDRNPGLQQTFTPVE